MSETISIQRKNAYQMNPRDITVNPETNPRKDYGGEEFDALKNSIKERGLIQAVSVHEVREGGKTIRVELTHGFRRMKAINELLSEGFDIPTIPVHKSSGERKEVVIDHIVLNQAKNLAPLEKASAIVELKANGLGLKEIAKLTGIGYQTVFNLFNFATKASKKIKEAVSNGTLTITTAGEIVRDSESKSEQDEKLTAAITTADRKGKKRVSNTDVPMNKRSFGKKGYLEFCNEFIANNPESTASELHSAVCEKFGFRLVED